MKHVLSLVFFTTALLTANCQDYKFIYYLDADLNFTQKDKAVATGKAYEKNGLVIMDCYAKNTGQKILSASFTDSTLAELHGLYTSFSNNAMESQGNYRHNIMDGVWKYWNREGLLSDSVIYDNGTRIAYASCSYSFQKFFLYRIPSADTIRELGYTMLWSFTDSLNNKFTEKEYTIKRGIEHLNYEVFFTGNKGLLKEYDSTGKMKTDSVYDRKLQDAEFPGGEAGWRNFLQKNLNLDILENGVPEGTYTTLIRFVVNTDGRLTDISIESNPGYGLGREGERVLKLSPKWKPAVQYGRTVKVIRYQPVSFSLITN